MTAEERSRINERQGHWLIEQCQLTREQVHVAWQCAERQSTKDLLAVAVELGFLDAEALGRARRVFPVSFLEGGLPGPDSSLKVAASGLRAADSSGSRDVLFIAGYELIEEINRGGMGAIWLARDERSGQDCLIKVMLAAKPSAEATKRFLREARALERLDHRNVVKILDIGMHNGRPYFAMERVQGLDLRAIVRRGVPEFGWVYQVFKELAMGLVECHARGLVHRDIKPGNVLIEDGTSRPVLIDFGLAREDRELHIEALESQGESLTKSGQVLGTPAYMAPEQLDSSKGVSDKADVWGFGATLFEALTGRAPYVGATAINIYKQLVLSQPPAPETLNKAVPLALSELCQRCFQRDPEVRPSMAELVEHWPEFFEESSRAVVKKAVIAGVILVALLLLGLGLLSLTGYWSEPELFIDSLPDLSGRAQVEVSGTVVTRWPKRVHIKRSGEPVVSLELVAGRFQWNWPLKVGDNKAVVLCEDGWGHFSKRVTLFCHYDSKPPELKVKLPKRTFDYKLSFLLESDEPLSQVKVQGRVIDLASQKSVRVSHVLPLGRSSIDLEVMDRSGQVTRRSFSIQRDRRVIVAKSVVAEYPDLKPYSTITEAIAALGRREEEVVVFPGVYEESVIVERDLRLVAAGEAVIVGVDKAAIENRGAKLGVEGLTLRLKERKLQGTRALVAFLNTDGQSTLRDCVIESDHTGVSAGPHGPGESSERGMTLERCVFRNIKKEQLTCSGLGQLRVLGCHFLAKSRALRIGAGQPIFKDCVFMGSEEMVCYSNFSAEVTFQGCSFSQCQQTVIYSDSSLVVLNDCQIFDCGVKKSQRVKNWGHVTILGTQGTIRLRSCGLKNVKGTAIRVGGTGQIDMSGCRVEEGFEKGLVIDSGKRQRHSIRDCVFRGGLTGAYMSRKSRIEFKKCEFSECELGFTTNSIRSKSVDLILEDCHIHSCRSEGIRLVTGRVILRGGVIEKNGGEGVRVEATAQLLRE